MKKGIAFILVLICFQIKAQTNYDKDFYLVDELHLDELNEADRLLLDSCLGIFHDTNDDSTKVLALNGVCEQMMHEDWGKYQHLQYEVIKQALKKIKAAEDGGFFKAHLAGALNNLGYIHQHQGDIKVAIKYYHKALKIQIEIGDKAGMGYSYNNIGFIHQIQEDEKLALEFFEQSLAIREEVGDKKGEAESLNNIAAMHHKQNKVDMALAYYLKSLAIKEEIKDLRGIVMSYNNIGSIYQREAFIADKDKDEIKRDSLILLSLEYHHRCLPLAKKLGSVKEIAMCLYNIAAMKIQQNETDSASYYLHTGLDFAQKAGAPRWISGIANMLSTMESKQGDHMMALKYYKLHIQMKDSINNEENQKATIRQQTQYEFEKAQIVKENEAKEEARLEAEATGRRNNLQYSLIFLGILVLFGVVLSLGFIKVSPNIAEGLIFFAFLILFEFVLVFVDPYMEQYTHGEPMYNLAFNAGIALLIFPLHAVLERLLKKRIVK